MSNDTLSTSAGSQRRIEFEEIEHTADRALRIYGANLEQLLLNAALGMNSLMVSDLSPGSGRIRKSLEIDALDAESLLVEWLSELSYWAEIEMLIFHEFEIANVSATHLKATIHGSRMAQLDKHIKAVTYHDLKIVQTDRGLAATVVFDV